ncbi:RecQ family ATP-dependent DNA helicase [Moraxella nasicaprae]|uniref:DNA 3'-5' helicase n=1 Tax=Moraxella nasicaprae TaxID=2904122 RepID=A0ABY6F562_9GAMM|nr:RecQ family ATP-dependent DNA helicase [Moraxella nasicaprae]UXZ05231.1 RecQ family ATP-dependent DNA helicase [Moraxella nasicaprae]
MHFNPSRALELLRQGSSNPNAKFRDGQEEAITHLVTSTQRLLVVQKTGWGKSFVYFIATQLLRESGAGITLLISPLLALMRNQIAAAKRMGLKAVSINSENTDDWKQIEQEIILGQVDIVLISPERLANQNFINNVLSQIAGNIGLLVIDEAHCISDWGHDFRPDYRLIERIIKNLPPNLRVLATTATANQRVMDDLIAILGPNIAVSRGDLNRPSLTLQTIKLPSQIERLAWLAEQLSHLQGSGIIYTLTVRDANQVADWLKLQGFDVEAYTGESGDKRIELEDKLLNNQVKALVATTALGMGYDKPDLGFVIHYQMPNSVVAYYQQVGRAGRALSNAYGVLLSGIEDDEISAFFIDSAFPKPNEVNQILNALKQSPNGLSSNELQDNINLSQGRISKALKVLSLESPAPLVKQDTKWQLTSATLSTDFWQRVNRLTELRKNEHQQMKNYVDLPFGQHMAFLVNALDGDTQQIMPPQLPPLPTLIHPTFVQQASEFLHRSNVIIEPRKKWATGGSTQFSQKGNINPNFQAEEGRALSIWGDAGWGKLVKQGKYQDNHFADELVNACCEMIERWQPNPKPTWVTCVPSLRHPDLVPDFARRLAMKLGLPFMPIIQKIKETEPQKMMQNSHMQAHNLDGVFQLSDNPLSEPVLLIDDMVDSRWTLTICSYLLKFNGSGAVFPLVLSQTSNQGE